ncbi:unnamed protein product (macronuclear) [Paramecium tetraurelia]|uniref:Uncharacterized protein n=1 Tax=Paramecium tetraurelia TaxID=5888 RepID=A0C5J8_PARTE|nr:uncharacterized protein GSPATT00035194001 [Paramecium tetraurelia]CAK66065.1 unnamed protein product [Paramecium tetraurelia]|eukprot:XP_001433462.1 hypothetical protein (macronuclear) [Paramecium tetraurelia strain d4-2]
MALAIEPKNVEILLKKFHALLQLEKYQKAIQELDNILNIDNQNEFCILQKGTKQTKQLGFCLKLNKEYQMAIRWFDKALQFDSKNLKVIDEKGQCLLKLNEFDEAIKCIDLALSINPKHVPSLAIKGDCLLSKNLYENALSILELALQINPYDVCTLSIKGTVQTIYREMLIIDEQVLRGYLVL